MEHFVSLEIWAVLVAAPCMIAWFLGEMHGAARIRRMIEAGELGDMPEALRSAAKGAPSARTQPDTVSQNGSAATSAVGQTAATGSTDSLTRHEALAALPSLTDLHEQAQRIRETDRVWDDPELREDLCSTDPISARVLQHYRGSISELGRRNALTGFPTAVPEDAAQNRSDTEFV